MMEMTLKIIHLHLSNNNILFYTGSNTEETESNCKKLLSGGVLIYGSVIGANFVSSTVDVTGIGILLKLSFSKIAELIDGTEGVKVAVLPKTTGPLLIVLLAFG